MAALRLSMFRAPWVATILRAKIWAGALCLPLLGCASAPIPCLTPSDCGRGSECLANRCLPLGELPVSSTTGRTVLPLERFRFVGERARPDAVDLGFEMPELEGPLVAAFLIVPTAPDRAVVGRVLELEARLLLDPWSQQEGRFESAEVTSAPRASFTRARAITRGGTPARIDVTRLVARWLDNPRATHGLRVEITDSDAKAALLASNAGSETRLELYGAPVSPPGSPK